MLPKKTHQSETFNRVRFWRGLVYPVSLYLKPNVSTVNTVSDCLSKTGRVRWGGEKEGGAKGWRAGAGVIL